MMNLAYGPVQFRLSEALSILPFFTPAAIPGLAIGCFISNLASPLGIVDWIFGTSATLIAASLCYMLRKIKVKDFPIFSLLVVVPVNAIIVGFELSALSSDNIFNLGNFDLTQFYFWSLSVGFGELVVCLVLGIPLFYMVKKIWKKTSI